MFYIIGDGRIIDQSQNCPNQASLEMLADECELDELWVLSGEHSGIVYTRPEEETRTQIVFGQPETYPYPSAQNSNMPTLKR